MTKPTKKANSGYYYFRKAVPEPLQWLVGKTAIVCSLKTKSYSEALTSCAELDEQWDGVFRKLQSENVRLNHQQRVGLAGLYYKDYVAKFRDEPEHQSDVDVMLNALANGNPGNLFKVVGRPEKILGIVRARHRARFKGFVVAHGLNLSPDEIDLTMPHVLRAMHDASARVVQFKEGNYGVDPMEGNYPSIDWSDLYPTDNVSRAVDERHSTLSIFDKMASEREYSKASIKRHRPIIEKVAEAHPDIRTITANWCVDWKDALLESGLSPRTVQQAHLSALRSLCNFAVANGYLAINPALGLTIKVRKKIRNRTQKGYTDAEAVLVLSATLSLPEDLPDDQRRARRWIPWLCCYSGARVGEIAQLRKRDFRLEEGVWVMEILPEAGTVKTGQARRVPIHPHLLAQGLMTVVKDLGEGYVFCDADGKRSPKTVADDLARWVREVGVTDVELQPSHGWRHRFKTVARRLKMDPAVRDYLQGHAPHNEAEGYGDQEAAVLLEWISTIKWMDIEGTTRGRQVSSSMPGPALVWSR